MITTQKTPYRQVSCFLSSMYANMNSVRIPSHQTNKMWRQNEGLEGERKHRESGSNRVFTDQDLLNWYRTLTLRSQINHKAAAIHWEAREDLCWAWCGNATFLVVGSSHFFGSPFWVQQNITAHLLGFWVFMQPGNLFPQEQKTGASNASLDPENITEFNRFCGEVLRWSEADLPLCPAGLQPLQRD